MGADHNDRSKDAPQLLGATAFKPVERHGFDIIKYLIYDPDKGEIFTRTPKSWFLITLFYCIYYSCLAAFWYGMLQLFFITLPLEKPKYTLEENIIGINPGLGMRPAQTDANIASSMLYIKAKAKSGDARPSKNFESEENIDWAKRLEKFLDQYKNSTNIRDCAENKFNTKYDACKFDIAELGSCGTYPYGYFVDDNAAEDAVVSPCVLLKLNRIYDWEPLPFDPEYITADEDPDDPIPENVKTLAEADNKNVYVDCRGENPADMEALDGNLEYFPKNQGLPFKYFPYTQAHNNYQSPLVAVKFNNLPIGQLIHVECKVWANKIKHYRRDKIGMIRFEVFLDGSGKNRRKREL